jgi:hypothetical protein
MKAGGRRQGQESGVRGQDPLPPRQPIGGRPKNITCIAYSARHPPSAKHEIWRKGSKSSRKTPVFGVLVRQLAEGGSGLPASWRLCVLARDSYWKSRAKPRRRKEQLPPWGGRLPPNRIGSLTPLPTLPATRNWGLAGRVRCQKDLKKQRFVIGPGAPRHPATRPTP